jgi:hypothetical protein
MIQICLKTFLYPDPITGKKITKNLIELDSEHCLEVRRGLLCFFSGLYSKSIKVIARDFVVARI